ncbi:MAG: lysophospholipid acyltransferase family protein [Candidatus Dormiibacterota bacterium]
MEEAIETSAGEAAAAGEEVSADRRRRDGRGGARTAPPVTPEVVPPLWARAIYAGVGHATGALGRHRFVVSDAAAALTCRLHPDRLEACAARHRRADPRLTAAQGRLRARASYREYYRTVTDLFWAHTLTMDEVRRRHPIDGWEHIDAAIRNHGAGLFCLAHFGNWDMAATMAMSRGVGLSTVMREFRPAFVNQMIVWTRERRGLEVFTPWHAARGLLQALRRHRFPALLADIPEGGGTVEVRFRGGPVLFSTGPAALARRSGCPMLPVACFREADRYRIVVDRPVARGSIAEMTQELADRLDALIVRAPEQWYPFNQVWTDEP